MNISSVNSFPVLPQDNRSSTLDVDGSGLVTFNDLVRFRGAPVLETAEPNTPQVDNFDVNRDGIVTTTDISNKFSQNSESALRKDLGISAIQSRMDKILATISENRQALSTLVNVQTSSGENTPSTIDVIV